MSPTLPRYPVYVISKGRSHLRHTSRFLELDEVPYKIVIEEQEYDDYAAVIDPSNILVLPFANLGQGSIPARNWVWEHSISEGHDAHWILDDNIRRVYRLWYGHRIPCDSGPAFWQIEEFANRFENVALAGMNYKMFGLPNLAPYFLNTHVYSCILIRNDIPFRWRLLDKGQWSYNEDTDLCLQAVTANWCTVLVNVFLADKLPTMTMAGGNTDELYVSRGRLRMAKSLAATWQDENLVRVDRRWQRPQHVVDWRRFKQPLIAKKDVTADWSTSDESGLTLIDESGAANERVLSVLADYQTRAAV